jgi:hypothetical protein
MDAKVLKRRSGFDTLTVDTYIHEAAVDMDLLANIFDTVIRLCVKYSNV